MLSDPDREVNFSDSKLVQMLEMNSRQEVAVVAEEVAVDVKAPAKAHAQEIKVVVKEEGEERLLPTTMKISPLCEQVSRPRDTTSSKV